MRTIHVPSAALDPGRTAEALKGKGSPGIITVSVHRVVGREAQVPEQSSAGKRTGTRR